MRSELNTLNHRFPIIVSLLLSIFLIPFTVTKFLTMIITLAERNSFLKKHSRKNSFTWCLSVMLVLNIFDLAIANENEINFFSVNGTKLEFSSDEISQLKDFYMLTHDHLSERILFSLKEFEVNIFAFSFSGKRLTPLVSMQKHDVLGIACDPVSQTLFWTDGNGHTIWKRSLRPENASNPSEPLLTLKDNVPAGIVVSTCKRLLFWTNINHLAASIYQSNLDGSVYKRIIFGDVFGPLAITVDEVNERLYWTDDQSGIYFKIESSDFEGKNRKLIVQGTNQEPIGIIALNNAIYWTDTIMKNVWTVSVDSPYTNQSSKPTLFYKLSRGTPYGIVAYRDKRFDCNAVTPVRKVQNHSLEKIEENSVENSYCLNGGNLVGNECRCPKGFSGLRCELSECHNFCLNGGRCFLSEMGRPSCQCAEGFSGGRCHVDRCLGYCLNGGKCSINDSKISCSCGNKYSGKRCETSLDFICHQACASFFEKVVCGCNATSSECPKSSGVDADSSHCEQQRIISLALICLEGLTMLVVVVLARKVCLLRRRPRIKKRIIINKGVRSQTPMTARPQMGTSEQCEITIENCCNMNICETPCFEPNLRSPRSSSKSLSKKTEDKKNLLKNMEGEFESSDVFYS